MSEQIARQQQDSEQVTPWKAAPPERGQQYVDIALSFLEHHPVGMRMTQEKFDAWAMENGLLTVPATDDKQSDAWKAFLQRRHELRYRINTAGKHPRMIHIGEEVEPFTIERVNGLLEVLSPHDAVARTNVGREVDRLVKHRKKELTHLMQSTDWASLPAIARRDAEALYDDIDEYADHIELAGKHLVRRFIRFRNEVKGLVDSGSMDSSNGGIRQLIEAKDDDVVEGEFEIEDDES